MQAFQDSLGVVEAVDADAQAMIPGQFQVLQHALPALLDRGPGRLQLGIGPLDRDWIAFDQGLLALEGDGRMLVLDARLQIAVDGLEEVLALVAGMEAEDGAAQQPLQDFAAPGADAEAFRIDGVRLLLGVRLRV